jgi:hypothetical protein
MYYGNANHKAALIGYAVIRQDEAWKNGQQTAVTVWYIQKSGCEML